MIIFRQKEFLTPLTRIAAKTRRFFRPLQYINPNIYLDDSVDLKKLLKKDIIHAKRQLFRAGKNTGKNAADVWGAAKKSSRGIFNRPTTPLNPKAAMLISTSGYKQSLPSLKETRADFSKAGEHIGNVLGRTKSAAVGPITPIPGATEALSVVGPFIDEFTPIGEIARGVINTGKKGVSILSKKLKNSKN